MILLKEIISQYFYVGDCVSGLDDNAFKNRVASDATELSGIIDDSTSIDRSEFVILTGRTKELAHEFGYNEKNDIAWSYNHNTDVHKFYVR